ncbi:DUF4340 domain-containing protein [Lewinella sp. JB7]|uniref:DUF4340 domain-containing protein n=1 Tax=Lewinella sp. JB7 TaxID=2962887 RepID=UPI0020CA17B7|nr:DUF4340 domain-containing protein [Lewinella sp. JB7]MCP9235063.1 DUF4340 domain-containing protein [Lewinella sp. JB7]
MKRTLILLTAVILLGTIAWYTTTPANTEPPADDRDFAYPRVQEIHRIYVADRNGREAELTRGGPTGWMYGGKHPANENVMKNLLQAIGHMEVQSLPTSKAIPNLVRNLAGGGILVRLFDRGDNKLRGYYIGGGANGELGTAAIMEGSDNPYIVHLPMWTGNLRHRFNLRDDEWRSKRLFAVDPARVEYLSIDYPQQRAESFRMQRDANGAFRVTPLYDIGLTEKAVSRGTAEGVLSRYEDYYISRYENGDEASIRKAREAVPFAVIRLKERDREEQLMSVFPRFADPTGGQLSAYTAFVNDGQDWALLAVETTQPLLLSYASF